MGTNSIRLLNRRAAYFAAAIAMIFATFIPVLVSAAQVTERSVQLSSSSAQATGVSYKVSFKTGSTNTGAFVVDFCSNTPLVSEECTAPAGLDVGTPTSATSNFTGVSKLADNTVRVTAATPVAAAGATVTVDIEGLSNPTATGPIYARIITFDNATNADLYDATSTGVTEGAGGVKDTGGVALYITPTIGVSGAVLESMTFCVANAAITPDCANASSNLPTIKLGEDNGGIISLNPEDVYEGNIYTQISTNAANGAVISLKSNAAGCGGLLRAGSPSACDIAPAQQTDIANGEAKFGLKTGTDLTDPTDGDLRVVPTSGYSNAAFALNYDADDEATGVTSPYGDPLLDTNSKPANNRNMTLTFGASVTNTTPAGLYSADLSMIATGKF